MGAVFLLQAYLPRSVSRGEGGGQEGIGAPPPYVQIYSEARKNESPRLRLAPVPHFFVVWA